MVYCASTLMGVAEVFLDATDTNMRAECSTRMIHYRTIVGIVSGKLISHLRPLLFGHPLTGLSLEARAALALTPLTCSGMQCDPCRDLTCVRLKLGKACEYIKAPLDRESLRGSVVFPGHRSATPMTSTGPVTVEIFGLRSGTLRITVLV